MQKPGYNAWCHAPLDEVRNNFSSTGYPEKNLIFIKGKVEDTIPKNIPARIALLRLDTDWYESTRHEMTHLYPHLQKNAVFITDDYGAWAGAKKAIDEYFSRQTTPMLLHRIDVTGRVGIKTT